MTRRSGTRRSDSVAALDRIDACHREDPDGQALDHAEAVCAWVLRLRPDASLALRIAARAQHIRRWQVPRDTFPRNRDGYLRWRAELQAFHADQAESIVAACGFEQVFIDRVGSLMRKEGLDQDPETRTLEDALCLVFMERQLAAFSTRHAEAKVQRILRKTWNKMSPAGQQAALKLRLPDDVRALIGRSVGATD
jgi:hypothetical protein